MAGGDRDIVRAFPEPGPQSKPDTLALLSACGFSTSRAYAAVNSMTSQFRQGGVNMLALEDKAVGFEPVATRS